MSSVTHLGEGSHEWFIVLHPPSCVHQDHLIVLLVSLGGGGGGRGRERGGRGVEEKKRRGGRRRTRRTGGETELDNVGGGAGYNSQQQI